MYFGNDDYFTISEPVVRELFDRSDCFPLSMRVIRLLIKDRGPNISYLEFGTGRLCSSFAAANMPNVDKVLSVDINPFDTNKGYKFSSGNRPLEKFEQYGAPKADSPISLWETKADIFERLKHIEGSDKITYWSERNSHEMTPADFADVGPFDVIYIDGDHSKEGVTNDWNLATEIIKPDGLIIFDDWANKDMSGVRAGIKETALDSCIDFFSDIGWHCMVDFRKVNNGR